MWEHKKIAFLWLDCSNKKLGCKTCKEVAQLGLSNKSVCAYQKSGVATWYPLTVQANSSVDVLKKKNISTQNSTGRATAEKIASDAKIEIMENVVD